jgi:hypothetical protein
MTRCVCDLVDDGAMTFPEEELPAVAEASQAWCDRPVTRVCGCSAAGCRHGKR